MVLLPKDYVLLRMTGEAASDLSDSAGTLRLDVAKRDWSGIMLSATGLDRSHMLTLFEGNAMSGQLRAETADAWGISRVHVAAGGGDHAAGAVGVGVVRSSAAFFSLGTSGVLFFANDGHRPNAAGGAHTFCPCAARSLAPDVGHPERSKLCRLGGAALRGQGCGVVVRDDRGTRQTCLNGNLPPLSFGPAPPHNDPNAKGVLLGMTHETDTSALAKQCSKVLPLRSVMVLMPCLIVARRSTPSRSSVATRVPPIGARTTRYARKRVRPTPYLRNLPEAEIHLLDTGHSALEDKLDEMGPLIRNFLDRKVAR